MLVNDEDKKSFGLGESLASLVECVTMELFVVAMEGMPSLRTIKVKGMMGALKLWS
ncbi:hypothetical protein Syun_011837 [Stephania yunnanensis]|uniref:Uncharacterized protein n=1 Tax=Stephania yunnanensis TaxID=152371 RepID=A0AAP0JYD2_9MAGN